MCLNADHLKSFLFLPKVNQVLLLFSCEIMLGDRKKTRVSHRFFIITSPLNKALCCLKGHGGSGQSSWEEGKEGGVPSATSCHQVLRDRHEQLQGSAETEEGLGDPTNQRGGEFSRTVPSDARQRKWQIRKGGCGGHRWFAAAILEGTSPLMLIVGAWWTMIKTTNSLASPLLSFYSASSVDDYVVLPWCNYRHKKSEGI